jgi:hypothetical protein
MNTVFLSNLLARNLTVGEALTDDAALELLNAINGGLSEYYQLAPDIYRRLPFRATLRAPESVSLVFSEKYSNVLSSPTLEDRQIGCSVRISGYGIDNRVASNTTLLDDWLDDDLTKDATIYTDAVAVNASIERITSRVLVRGLENSSPVELVPLGNGSKVTPASAGCPRAYWMEPIGLNQGGESSCLLRVHPFPDADYILSFEAILSGAKRVTFADLITAADIAVSQNYAESILVPLCEAILTGSPLWRDRNTKTAALNRAADAREKLSILPATFNPPANRVGTPVGY